MSTSVASVVSHFPDAENGFTTTTAGSVSSGATTVTLNSVAGYTNGEPVVFVIDPTDAAKKQTFTGIVDTSGVQITDVVWTAGTNQTHALGATVVDYATATHISMISKGIKVEHNQDGTHKAALITSRTEDTNPDPDADFLLIYDTSATALKKVLPSNLSGNLSGWTSNVLPSVSSVTNNGNRSYDVTFGSTVASYLTPGMRIRTSRTVAAPTQCADLESSSSQYFNDTSLTGMTFTDDFVVSAWVKIESYAQMGIISRYNGTSGFVLQMNSSGQVILGGYNAGAANFSQVTSYQSLPLGKWVHLAAQLDMSTFTATTTTSYIMFDGVDVPASVSRGGTNPTALVQAGNLEIGSFNAGTFFDGKIAQVAIYSAKVTQANIRATISQGLSGSETSLVSAYSFNNSIVDLNANANNLTAQGSAVATNADSPFTVDANGVVGGTYDFGIVTKVATTTATVQVPEGCAIPTSGGVSAVDLSSVKSPFGFPADEGRWRVRTLIKVNAVQNSPVNGTWYNAGSTSGVTGGHSLNIPVGAWVHGYETIGYVTRAGSSNGLPVYTTLSTANNTESDTEMTARTYLAVNSAVDGSMAAPHKKENNLTLSASATYYLNFKVDVASINSVGDLASSSPTIIYVKPAHL